MKPTKPTVKNNQTTTCYLFILRCLRGAGGGCRHHGRHTRHCYIKTFYGMFSSILNYFDSGKTVAFSGLIREICHGVPTEWVQPLRRKPAFHGFNRTFIIRTERSVFVYNVTERISARRETRGLLRSGYPPLKMSQSGADFFYVLRSGADIRRYKCHGAVRFDRTAP